MAFNYAPAPPRQASQQIKTEDELRAEHAAKIAAWEAANPAPLTRQQEADRLVGAASPDLLGDFFKQQAQYNSAWNDPAQQAWYRDDYNKNLSNLMVTGSGTASDSAFIGSNPLLDSFSSYDYDKLASDRQRALDGMNSEFQGGLDYTKQNAERQGQAYKQQTGGGFAGGIIDASYSDPFSNQISGKSVGGLGGLGGMQTDPSMPNVAMPWQQPWGTPGFGQPGQGNSQGVGGYSPTGQQSTNQQGSQWGGVFGAKNPWSPA